MTFHYNFQSKPKTKLFISKQNGQTSASFPLYYLIFFRVTYHVAIFLCIAQPATFFYPPNTQLCLPKKRYDPFLTTPITLFFTTFDPDILAMGMSMMPANTFIDCLFNDLTKLAVTILSSSDILSCVGKLTENVQEKRMIAALSLRMFFEKEYLFTQPLQKVRIFLETFACFVVGL